MSRQYTYTYDDSHRLTQVALPSTATIQYNYSQGRLGSVVTPDGTTSIAYDNAGRVYTVTRGSESATFGYDGDLLTSRTLSGTLNQTLTVAYDDDFSVESVTYAGATENFAYDDDDLLTGAGDFTIVRNAQNGLPESVTDGTATVTRTINGYGEVTGVSTVVNGTTVSWSTTLDDAGRITAKSENVGGTATTYGYTYDDLGHLETVTKNGTPDEDYTVDNKGRRLLDTVVSRSISNRSFTYDDEDRMLTAGGASYTYDDDGYLSTKTVGSDVTTYTYSRNGALKSVTLPSTDVIDFVLDAGEQRIAKKVNGVVTEKYLWSGLTGLLAVYDGSDTLIARFEYADGPMPVKMVQGGNTYYLAYDQVGSLRAVIDTDGNIAHEVTYDSFGNILTETNSGLIIPFGFAGGLHDRETGLVRFGYRDYDPDTGRWTAKDPIRFAGASTNLYIYCSFDPINCYDPSGLYEWSAALQGLGEGAAEGGYMVLDALNPFEDFFHDHGYYSIDTGLHRAGQVAAEVGAAATWGVAFAGAGEYVSQLNIVKNSRWLGTGSRLFGTGYKPGVPRGSVPKGLFNGNKWFRTGWFQTPANIRRFGIHGNIGSALHWHIRASSILGGSASVSEFLLNRRDQPAESPWFADSPKVEL